MLNPANVSMDIDNSESLSFSSKESGDRAKPEPLSVLESVAQRATAGSSLFISNVISSHFTLHHKNDQHEIAPFLDNFKLASNSDPLIEALYKRGYPIKSLNNLLKCGKLIGYNKSDCGCGSKIKPLTYNCSNKSCPRCSKIRKRRILNNYIPKFETQKYSQSQQLTFITISPKNYTSYKEGLENISEGISRLRRTTYFSNKSIFGCYVIEAKTLNEKGQANGWNVHIHLLLYGKPLDNRIRGFCLDCRQNLMKYDSEKKVYYCASSKCGSYNVKIKNKDSKLTRLCQKSFGRDVHVYIKGVCDGYRNRSPKGVLEYFLKYVSARKEDFASTEDLADYLAITIKQKSIVWFGKRILFRQFKSPCICKKCNQPIVMSFTLNDSFSEELKNPPPNISSTKESDWIICKEVINYNVT